MLELNPSTLKVKEPSAPFLMFILGLLTFADRKPFPDFFQICPFSSSNVVSPDQPLKTPRILELISSGSERFSVFPKLLSEFEATVAFISSAGSSTFLA